MERARELAAFLLGPLSDDGRLLRTWRDGRAKISAFSEDYGAVADGLLALHRATAKFIRRFHVMEEVLKTQGRELGKVGMPELDAIWDRIKHQPPRE